MTTVHTRIAPPPTSDPYVGTVYIALFNPCFTRQHGGQLILRTEDTNQLHSTRKSEQRICDALRWLDIEWDEGPDISGPHGPYRQSGCGHVCKKYPDELVKKGHALTYFCIPGRLDAVRAERMAHKEAPRYDDHCIHLPKDEVQRHLAAGEPCVTRMKVLTEGVRVVPGMLRGGAGIPWDHTGIQALMKAGGLFAHFLANVVDNHLMGITHVLRGEEWLPSALKSIELCEYFDWEQPWPCYMPLLRNPDKGKLFKHENPTSITFYECMGYLPQALLNCLGRIGWSMSNEREKFTLAEMIEHLDLPRVSLGGPIFDLKKLSWLNGQRIREQSVEEFTHGMQKQALNPEYLMKIAPHVQGRTENFSQIAPLTGSFFSGGMPLGASPFGHKKLDPTQVRQVLQLVLWKLESLRRWEKECITGCIQAVAEHLQLKLRDVAPLTFLAIVGHASSVSMLNAMKTLGADLPCYRLRQALEPLGGASKEETKG